MYKISGIIKYMLEIIDNVSDVLAYFSQLSENCEITDKARMSGANNPSDAASSKA